MIDTSKKHIKVTLNLIQITFKPPTIASQLPVTEKKNSGKNTKEKNSEKKND